MPLIVQCSFTFGSTTRIVRIPVYSLHLLFVRFQKLLFRFCIHFEFKNSCWLVFSLIMYIDKPKLMFSCPIVVSLWLSALKAISCLVARWRFNMSLDFLTYHFHLNVCHSCEIKQSFNLVQHDWFCSFRLLVLPPVPTSWGSACPSSSSWGTASSMPWLGTRLRRSACRGSSRSTARSAPMSPTPLDSWVSFSVQPFQL